MNLAQLKTEIERLIAQTPYTKEEVLSFFNAEPELTVDELMAYSVALDYLRGKKSARHKELLKQFTKKKYALMKDYLT